MKISTNHPSTTAPGLLAIFDEHNAEIEKQVKSRALSKSTLTKYITIRKRLAEYLADRYQVEDLRLSKITRSFSNDFHEYLTDHRQMAHNTAVTYVWMLGKIFRFALEKKQIKFDPSLDYSYSKKQKQADYLSSKELQAIERVSPTSKDQLLVKHLFLFSCYTGLSYEELKTVGTDHIVVDRNQFLWLSISRGPSWEARAVPILVKANEIIELYNEQRLQNDTDLIFPVRFPPSTWRQLKEIAKMAGIQREFTFTIARYTFATTVALEYQMPISVVSNVLGSSSIKHTEEYQQLSFINLRWALKRFEQKTE